jgi:polysaccharide deacetylase family protein (PEP-CTERM system associated)
MADTMARARAAVSVPALRRPAAGEPLSAFTVDVEDWYQSCVDYDAPITERVVRNTDRILELLDARGVKGTFFVQGRVAETFPAMVRGLVEQGHEVQSHGYSHRPLYAMNRAELHDELERSRKTVEDAAGTRVTAFRAQDFSILAGNLWALDTLAEVGFEIDSSIFPMKSARYGIAGWEVAPHHIETPSGARILEVPVAILTLRAWRLPVAGGGYFRVLPAPLLERALRAITAHAPAVVYCHPYEFSSGELGEYRGAVDPKVLLAQGIGRRSVTGRISALVERLPFGRFDRVLSAWGVT